MFKRIFSGRYRTLTCLCLALCLFYRGNAQVSFFYNEDPSSIQPGLLFYYTDSSSDRSWERYTSISTEMQSYSRKVPLNYKNSMLWLRVELKEISKNESNTYLMIRNPHINYLKVWLVKNDSIIKNFPITGDRIAFHSRTINHADFVYPLPADMEGYSMVILADKRNELFTLPLHILSDEGFLKFNRKKNLLTGLIMGLGIFLFFFNLFLFVQMKERLYVFYGLYIFMGLFYIFSDYGYSFMFLFPDNPMFADFSRPIAISLASPLYLFFCIELLALKKRLPVAHRWLRIGLICYLSIFLVSVPFMVDKGTIRVILQNLMQVLLTILVLGNLTVAMIAWRKKVRYAGYIVVTSLFLFATISLFSLYLSGDIEDTLLTRNLMNLGFVGEICILAFALSLRFKNYKEQSEELLKRSNQQQEQIFKTVTDYQEKELQRLSSLLHDSVGARLSALRFNLESDKTGMSNGKMGLAIEEINSLANDVRQFSHSFSPILLQKKGLKASLHQFIKPINESGQLNIQLEMIGSHERTSFRYELLIYSIVQELIQNIIKHARATEAIVQIMLEEEIVSIFVEDNGVGFNKDSRQEGLGFSQIKQLVTFVNGTFRIESSESTGTNISIEFTTIPDERKHQDTYRR